MVEQYEGGLTPLGGEVRMVMGGCERQASVGFVRRS